MKEVLDAAAKIVTIAAGGIVVGESIEKRCWRNSEKKNTSNEAKKPGTGGDESSKGSNAN